LWSTAASPVLALLYKNFMQNAKNLLLFVYVYAIIGEEEKVCCPLCGTPAAGRLICQEQTPIRKRVSAKSE